MKIFQDWFAEHFCPPVKRYCKIKKREQRALLLIDNAPSHPTNLSDLPTCIPVEVVFLLPNTTALIQPVLRLITCGKHLSRCLKKQTEKRSNQ